MSIIDISMTIDPKMIVYPGDTVPEFRPICTIEKSGCNMTEMKISSHTGTHIDAPSHFLKDKNSIEKVDLEKFIGLTQVVEVHTHTIDANVISNLVDKSVKRILFKTINSRFLNMNKFSKSHVYLTEDGAEFLVSMNVILVGIDYITIERFGTPDFKVHKILLSANIPILEGLDLSDVNPGYYILVALPLKLKGLDGSPVRAVLIPKEAFGR